MKEKKPVDLTDEELQKKWKDIKLSNQITQATLIIAILITIIRTVVSGFSFSLFYMPAFIALITFVLRGKFTSVQKEIVARNLVE